MTIAVSKHGYNVYYTCYRRAKSALMKTQTNAWSANTARLKWMRMMRPGYSEALTINSFVSLRA